MPTHGFTKILKSFIRYDTESKKMAYADPQIYLSALIEIMKKHWPDNRTINIVCHGHSVPAGYFATPLVDTFNAYPHLLHKAMKERFPFAVINVIVTAIGGETSEKGAARFEKEVLCHRPDVVIIDYGLNDRRIGLDAAKQAWAQMIKASFEKNAKLLLCTPTPDITIRGGQSSELQQHATQIRLLAENYEVGLVDSFETICNSVAASDINEFLSWSNHPNKMGHEIVAKEILKWFPVA